MQRYRFLNLGTAWPLTLFFFALLGGPLSAGPAWAGYEFDRAESGTIYFKLPEGSDLPSHLKTELHELKYLGQLQSPGEKPPYFIFSGKPCADCLLDSAIHLLRPGQPKPSTFVYPGKILDSRTRQLLLQSRAFYGHCLKSRSSDVYVVFQQERIDRKHRLMSSVYIAEPGTDTLEERLLERGLPRINDTLRLVKAKHCKEIEGRNRTMVKKAIDTRRPLKQDADDDEEDSPNSSSESVSGDDASASAPASGSDSGH